MKTSCLFFNLFFNWVDILYELTTFNNAYHAKDWNMAGIYIGKIFADVFFKAPYMSGWNYKNSDVLSNNWGTAPLLLNGLN